jgi:hypothetical protein
MQVLLKKNFLTSQECKQLNNWVIEGISKNWLDTTFDGDNGFGYKKRISTRAYGSRFEYPEIAYQVFNKITDLLNLHDVPKSVVGGGKDGIVVSCTFPSGNLFPHIDGMDNEFHVLRCNVMTQAADDGAKLFIGGNKIDIEIGDLHCYLASNVEHYVTEAKGNTPRIMWMFGYGITLERFNKLDKFSRNIS